MIGSHCSVQAFTVARWLTEVLPSRSTSSFLSRSLRRTTASIFPETVMRRRAPDAVQPASIVPTQRPSDLRW